MRYPARHDEDVARLPMQHGVADPRLALALDADIDRRVSRAIGLAVEPPRQHLNKGADRRHRRVAACRVHIAQLVAVIRIGLAVLRKLGEGLAAAGVRVVEHRRGFDLGLPVDRQQVVAEAGEAVALRPAHRLDIVGARLGEAGVQELDELDVEPVEPDHRLGAVVAVIVPGPGWGDHEIARLHRRALAIDSGVGATSFDNEAQGRLRMAVRRRHFARQDQLQPGE